PHHAVLARDVGRADELVAEQPGHRCVIHYDPTAELQQQRDLVLHAQPHAFEVDVDDAVPDVFRLVGRRHEHALEDTGVVEGAVEASVAGDGTCERGLDLCAVAHVGVHEARLATFTADGFDGQFTAGRVDIGDDDGGALARHHRGGR